MASLDMLLAAEQAATLLLAKAIAAVIEAQVEDGDADDIELSIETCIDEAGEVMARALTTHFEGGRE